MSSHTDECRHTAATSKGGDQRGEGGDAAKYLRFGAMITTSTVVSGRLTGK